MASQNLVQTGAIWQQTIVWTNVDLSAVEVLSSIDILNISCETDLDECHRTPVTFI